MIERAEREYHPHFPGIHVCGFTGEAESEDERPATLANHAFLSNGDAQRVWESAREELREPDGVEGDVLVDLCLAPHTIEDNFWMRMQMLPRLETLIANARTASPTSEDDRT